MKVINNKRLGIYFFYDKQGIVDRFVPYFLDDLCKNLTKLIIICNGKLNDEGKEILSKYGEVIVRENKGFDVWAYKTALQHVGWEELETYEEVVMLNSTIMGPMYSLSETFTKMNDKDLDFWGLTKYFKYDGDPFGCIEYGYIPDHIQSHFIVCRNSLVKSKDFHDYWDHMPMIHNYSEAIGKHEAIFTKHFADMGYKWDVSVNVDELRNYSGYPLMMCPTKLIKEYRCPIFKRRSFFHDKDDYLRNTTGESVTELYNYIKNETDYNEDFIWEAILRDYHQSDIVKNMNLTYIMPSKVKYQNTFKSKIALLIHLYFPDLLEENKHYIESMPKDADIYITTNTQEKKQAIEKAYKDLQYNHLEVRIIENRGRDVSSLLVGVKDVIMNYDLVCFAHDKKTAQVKPGTSGASFAYKCFENTLSNNNYVENIISTFEQNPRLGLLTPPEPNHDAFFPTCGFEWGPNFDNTKKLADELGLTVPMSAYKSPVAPLGTMFWFRPKAMQPLYAKDWEYNDFPPEPNGIDGSLLHAIERIYPFIVQQAGYYPAVAMTEEFAAIEYQNLHHYVQGYNRVMVGNGVGPYYKQMMGEMNYIMVMQHSCKYLIKKLIKNILKKIFPLSFLKAVKKKVKKEDK